MGVTIFGMFLMCSAAFVASTSAAAPALMLTPLIKKNNTITAREQSSVNASYFFNLTSYSGFLTVDESLSSHLFFWFFPAPNKTMAETPWIIWLQGGPGASSMAGLFDEMGPFEYDKELKLREWAWTKEYSMLFIDNPVGAGFSFTNSEKGFIQNMTMCSEQLYSAIQQFLAIFPELRQAPLFVAGESYAGRYIPALGIKVWNVNQNTNRKNEAINMQGLMMGNPVLDRDSIQDIISVYYQWGLIDSQTAVALKPLQDDYKLHIKNHNNSAALNLREKLWNKLDDISNRQQTFNLLNDGKDLRKFKEFIDKPEIKEALHVGSIPFTFSNASVHKWLVPDFLSSVRPKLESLLEHYRILIYCGQLDLTSPCAPNALARRKTWNWSGRKQFMTAPRTPWWFNNSVAGYTKTGGGLKEVLVSGAGHLVPMDKPAQAQQLISYFIRGLDLPVPINYVVESGTAPDLPLNFNSDFIVPASSEIKPPDTMPSSNAGLTASVVINVILIVGILIAALLFIRWKRRNEAFFYTTTDSITDGILSMS